MTNDDLNSFLVSLENSFKGPLYKKLIGRIRETGDVDAVITGATAISGMTMLQVAAAHGDADIAGRLIGLGADCNAGDHSGTPLLLSRLKILCSLIKEKSEKVQIRKEADMVKLLIRGGADITLRDPSLEEKELSGIFKDAFDYAKEIPDETIRNEILGLLPAKSG